MSACVKASSRRLATFSTPITPRRVDSGTQQTHWRPALPHRRGTREVELIELRPFEDARRAPLGREDGRRLVETSWRYETP